MTPRKLTLTDIADVRAYEREREEFRTHVIALKRRRRVHVGLFVTFLFENRDTIRFQIQEMARVEKLTTDDDIQVELDTYNPIIPDVGQVCATMFIELTTDEQMREWLTKLAGVENAVRLVLSDSTEIPAIIDEQHSEGLTRDHVTAAVHYLRWEFSPEQVAAFAAGAVQLRIDHPEYLEAVELSDATHAELLDDLG
ncbi:MAG: DUF3501 family protein [Ilumatobacteraceae bacterium]